LVNMMLIDDIKVEKEDEYLGKEFIGNFYSHKIGVHSLNDWTQCSLAPIVSYTLVVPILSWGWIGFIFQREKDVKNIMKAHWFCESSYLALRP